MKMWIFGLQNRYEIFTCRSLLTVTGRLASTCYEDQAGGRAPSVRQEPRVFKYSEPCRHYCKTPAARMLRSNEIQGARRSTAYFKSRSRIKEHSHTILCVCLVLKLPGRFVHIISTRDNPSSTVCSWTSDFYVYRVTAYFTPMKRGCNVSGG
jgi:hypothetical protein